MATVRWSWKRPSVPRQYREWFQENQWWLQIFAIAVFTFVMVIAFKQGNWLDWVGFKGKTVWDWLDLLGVPVSLAILGYILQQQQNKRAKADAREQREIAANEAREEILQGYFDRLSTLVVDKNLLAIAAKVYPGGEGKATATIEEKELFNAAVDVIRARTLSILRRFRADGERKGSVIRFLLEAELISKARLSLSGADLSDAQLTYTNLSSTDLSNANLSKAHLSKANLSGVDLRSANLTSAIIGNAKLNRAILVGADLTNAILIGADLTNASLVGAVLVDAHLGVADLSNAKMQSADLSGAQLSATLVGTNLGKANLNNASLVGADLRDARLNGADLTAADISKANFEGADLRGATLAGAKLEEAKITQEQLSRTKP